MNQLDYTIGASNYKFTGVYDINREVTYHSMSPYLSHRGEWNTPRVRLEDDIFIGTDIHTTFNTTLIIDGMYKNVYMYSPMYKAKFNLHYNTYFYILKHYGYRFFENLNPYYLTTYYGNPYLTPEVCLNIGITNQYKLAKQIKTGYDLPLQEETTDKDNTIKHTINSNS